MNKFIRPASLLLYLMMFVDFFFVGAFVAGFIGATNGQGLAAGAIVLGYGILFAAIAQVAAFFIVQFVGRKQVKLVNGSLLIALVVFILVFIYRFIYKQ